MDVATVDTVISIINGVGFPIFVAIAMFWQNHTRTEHYQTLLREMTTIIDNNTDSIEKLTMELRKGV